MISIPRPIRILLISPNPILLHGIQAIFETKEQILTVGVASSGDEGIKLCKDVGPDIALLSWDVAVWDDAVVWQTIIKELIPARVIIIAPSDDYMETVNAMYVGAHIGLPHAVSSQQLLLAVYAAFLDYSLLPPTLVSDLIQIYVNVNSTADIGNELTQREKEVLFMVTKGASNTEIADALSISLSTTKYHIANIFAKLKVSNRVEATRWAVQHKILK